MESKNARANLARDLFLTGLVVAIASIVAPAIWPFKIEISPLTLVGIAWLAQAAHTLVPDRDSHGPLFSPAFFVRFGLTVLFGGLLFTIEETSRKLAS